ncbi:MAG TPA: inosine/xanthosine triphosphatase [archaeon]|nr:inosine/xanthosine triphosphatase [archaeon]
MKVVVGSQNPVKLQAVREVFSDHFGDVEVKGVPAESGVSDQPFSNETFLGALARAKSARELVPDADFWVGLEGGLTWLGDRLMSFNATAVLHPDDRVGLGTSGMHELPPPVAKGIKDGGELGPVMDGLMNTHNIKHKEGAVGVFTDNRITRLDFCKHSLHLALAPFLKPDLFSQKQK